MSVTDKASCLPDWTIKDLLAEMPETRKNWEEQFNENCVRVADKIAESITKIVFERFRNRLLYSQSLPDKCKETEEFSLSLAHNAKYLKEWSQDAAELPPFKQWFADFENGNVSEVSVRQSLMDKLSDRIELILKRNLEDFANNPNNSGFKYEVTWKEESE